ncbi:MAG TPA: lysylphosphatidylglycerol synthase transmembrane domain-containing protein [Acidimicrobiales bacterium]|nr:lysylphosphatidylglycerol synthase transmembrane domain-containing protein [Acidimicrobiales bacterium]
MRTLRQDGQTAMGRHPRDVARVVLASAVVTVCFLAADSSGRVNALEAAIYRDLQGLPAWLQPVSHALILSGSPAAIAGAAGIALILHRVRLGGLLVVGGTAGWLAGHLLTVFTSPRLLVPPDSAHTIAAATPADHMAVLAALVTVASPYLPRVLRRLVVPYVGLAAVALDWTGKEVALGIIAGAFVGWACGTLVHLAAGAPGRALSPTVVQDYLRAAGLEPAGVSRITDNLWGPVCFEAATAGGDCLFVEVVRHGQRRAGWAYKARRLMASLEVEDEPALSSPAHEVEHEAYITMLAERAGVRTPAIVHAGALPHGPALLVRRKIGGRPLSEFEPAEITADLLEEAWRQVALLGAAGIAHHDLRASNILVDDKADPWLVDFTFARTGAARPVAAQDVAEMLVSMASVAGNARAVDAAVSVMPEASLRAAVTYLQPLALPSRIRQQLGNRRGALAELAEELAGRVGETRPSFRPRIRATTVLSLAVGGGAVYLLLPQVGTVPRLLDALKAANYWWLVLAFLAGAFTFPMAAASYAGAVRRRLPMGRTTMVQIASAFTSRLTPGGLGGMGINMIFLERQGTPRPEAIGSIALNQAAGVVVHATLFLCSVIVLGTGGLVGKLHLPASWPVLTVVAGVLVGAGVFLSSPLGRRRVIRPGVRVVRDLTGTLRDPLQAAALFGGSAGVTLGNAFALVASLAAFVPHMDLLSVLAVYVGGAAIASAAPTPGNLGAVEATLLAGLTGLGIASSPAVAAVLTFRLLTFWLPILPGLAAFRYLQYKEVV